MSFSATLITPTTSKASKGCTKEMEKQVYFDEEAVNQQHRGVWNRVHPSLTESIRVCRLNFWCQNETLISTVTPLGVYEPLTIWPPAVMVSRKENLVAAGVKNKE